MNVIVSIYYKTCLDLGLAPIESPETKGFKLKLGKHFFHFRKGYHPFNSASSAFIANNKYSTNKLLQNENIPVPDAIAISKKTFYEEKIDLNDLNYPVVAKPTVGGDYGYDVTCNIKNKIILEKILKELFETYEYVSIEQFQAGLESYRVSLFFGKVIAITKRIPAHVVGDGEHSIAQLIEIANKKRKQFTHILPLGPIQIMKETEILFEELGINEHYIPMPSELIPLRYICNSTFGGTVIGLKPNVICKENAELLIKAAAVLNLNFVGFDFMCKDITIPHMQSPCYIIEANQNPDIRIHNNIITGVKIDVSKIVIKKMIRMNWHQYLKDKINPKNTLYVILVAGLLFFVQHIMYEAFFKSPVQLAFSPIGDGYLNKEPR